MTIKPTTTYNKSAIGSILLLGRVAQNARPFLRVLTIIPRMLYDKTDPIVPDRFFAMDNL